MPVGGADFLAAATEMYVLPFGLLRHAGVRKTVDDFHPCGSAAFRTGKPVMGHANGILLAGHLRRFPGSQK